MGRKKTNTLAYKKKISVVRKILKLVAGREKQGKGKYVYWGFDTEMEAEEIERTAVNKLDHFLRDYDVLDEIFVDKNKTYEKNTGGKQ